MKKVEYVFMATYIEWRKIFSKIGKQNIKFHTSSTWFKRHYRDHNTFSINYQCKRTLWILLKVFDSTQYVFIFAYCLSKIPCNKDHKWLWLLGNTLLFTSHIAKRIPFLHIYNCKISQWPLLLHDNNLIHNKMFFGLKPHSE